MKSTTPAQASKNITIALRLLEKIKNPVLYDNAKFYYLWERSIDDLKSCLH